MESKRDRFKRLSYSRGERLRREVRLIGNLANTKNYAYSKDDVNALFDPIDQAISEVKELFERNLESDDRTQD